MIIPAHLRKALELRGLELPANYQPGTVIRSKSGPTHNAVLLDVSPLPQSKEVGDSGPRIYQALISGYDIIDRHGEVIEYGAFAKAAGEFPDVALLWGHIDHNFPVGTIHKIFETPAGPIMQFSLSATQAGRDLEILIGERAVKAVSVGFMIDEWSIEDDHLHIKSADLFEVSLVSVPANPAAVILSAPEAHAKALHPNQLVILSEGGVGLEVVDDAGEIVGVVPFPEGLVAPVAEAAEETPETPEEPAADLNASEEPSEEAVDPRETLAAAGFSDSEIDSLIAAHETA